MWIGICDDDKQYRTRLENEVRRLANESDKVTSYSNGSDLLDDIYRTRFPMDLLLLDMELPALSGIETARELQKVNPNTQIIIITNHEDYALQGYEIRPSNYLLKSAAIKQLPAEIERARRIAGDDIGEMLCIHSREDVAFVALRDIFYIESFNYKLHIHTETNTYKYVQKMGHVSDSLSSKGFCRTHKSYLVNLRHVKNIDRPRRAAILTTGKAIPVGEHRIAGVLAEYARFRQSLLPMNTAPDNYTGAAFGVQSVSRNLQGHFCVM